MAILCHYLLIVVHLLAGLDYTLVALNAIFGHQVIEFLERVWLIEINEVEEVVAKDLLQLSKSFLNITLYVAFLSSEKTRIRFRLTRTNCLIVDHGLHKAHAYG